MTNYQYLLIGGGMTAAAAVDGIRDVDSTGGIGLQNGRVRGVLLWNVWEQVEAARQLIAEPCPFTGKNLKGRLPAKTPGPKSAS